MDSKLTLRSAAGRGTLAAAASMLAFAALPAAATWCAVTLATGALVVIPTRP